MDRNEMPTEDEQFEAYKKVAVANEGETCYYQNPGYRRR